MSGVIDKNGQQWECCSECGEYVRFETLYYSPTKSYPDRRVDACSKCADPKIMAAQGNPHIGGSVRIRRAGK